MLCFYVFARSAGGDRGACIMPAIKSNPCCQNDGRPRLELTHTTRLFCHSFLVSNPAPVPLLGLGWIRRSGWEPCCWPRERRDTARRCPTRASCSTSRGAWRGGRLRTSPSRPGRSAAIESGSQRRRVFDRFSVEAEGARGVCSGEGGERWCDSTDFALVGPRRDGRVEASSSRRWRFGIGYCAWTR